MSYNYSKDSGDLMAILDNRGSVRLTGVTSIDLERWSKVGSSCHFECEASEVDDHVGDEEEHGHEGSDGVELSKKQGNLEGKGRRGNGGRNHLLCVKKDVYSY